MKKVILLFVILLLFGCTSPTGVDSIFIKEYLNNKYGDDITFTLSHMESCSTLVYESCTAFFTASDLGEDKEIYVVWNELDGSDMRDDYLFKKYDSQLREYYKNLISKVVKNKFTIDVQSNKSDLSWDKNLTFEEFLKFEKLNLGISINIANNDEDITSIGDDLKALFKKNKLKNISSLYITTYKKGCNLEELDKCKKVNSAYIEVKITDKFH